MAAKIVHSRKALCNRNCHIILFHCRILSRHFSDDSQSKPKDKSLYETLGVSSSATSREIKKAYYDLTFKHHPDRNVNCEDAALKFREVKEAYEILGNYASRKSYDRGIPVTKARKHAKPTVEHKAEFQEFFDSRSSKRTFESDDRSEQINDLGSFTSEKQRERHEKAVKFMKKETPEMRYVTQVVFGVFVCILVYRNMF